MVFHWRILVVGVVEEAEVDCSLAIDDHLRTWAEVLWVANKWVELWVVVEEDCSWAMVFHWHKWEPLWL